MRQARESAGCGLPGRCANLREIAAAVESIDAIDRRIAVGEVIVKRGYLAPTRKVRLHEAGHPVPDAAGVTGAEAVLALLRRVAADDLVLCVLSGGGSALLVYPADGLTLADLQATNELLLASGAGHRGDQHDS